MSNRVYGHMAGMNVGMSGGGREKMSQVRSGVLRTGAQDVNSLFDTRAVLKVVSSNPDRHMVDTSLFDIENRDILYGSTQTCTSAFGPCKLLSAGANHIITVMPKKKGVPIKEAYADNFSKFLKCHAFSGVSHGNLTAEQALRGGTPMIVSQVGGIVSLENTSGRGIPTGVMLGGLPRVDKESMPGGEGGYNDDTFKKATYRLGTIPSRSDIVPLSMGFHSASETVQTIITLLLSVAGTTLPGTEDNYFAKAVAQILKKDSDVVKKIRSGSTEDIIKIEECVSKIVLNWSIGSVVKGDVARQTIDVTLGRGW